MFSTDPGKYRHRITVQSAVNTRTQSGAYQITWVDFLVNIPAEVLTGVGAEPQAANAKQSKRTARINFRWAPGVEETMRVLWDGRPYDITSIESDSADRLEIRLRVEAGLTDGR